MYVLCTLTHSRYPSLQPTLPTPRTYNFWSVEGIANCLIWLAIGNHENYVVSIVIIKEDMMQIL